MLGTSKNCRRVFKEGGRTESPGKIHFFSLSNNGRESGEEVRRYYFPQIEEIPMGIREPREVWCNTVSLERNCPEKNAKRRDSREVDREKA